MRILLNGELREVPDGATVQQLLESLRVNPLMVAVEVNVDVLARDQYPARVLRDGDTVEVVHMVGGGDGQPGVYVYLDESGDLGFSEGSTALFTIAFVVLGDPTEFKRCVKRTKIKYRIPPIEELKGATTRAEVKADLLRRFSKIDMAIHSITVNKEKVNERLRGDGNILYNYMVGLSLGAWLLKQPKGAAIKIIVDRRITSITSGFDFDEYLKYKTWYEGQRSDLELLIDHVDSHGALSIQGIDVICNTIYRKFSGRDAELYSLIQRKVVSEKRLFFSSEKQREAAPPGD